MGGIGRLGLTHTHYWLLLLLLLIVRSCPTLWNPKHTRLPCPSLSPRVCSNSCPLSRWWHPTISSSVTHFSSCLQSFPASGFLPKSRLFTSCGQSIWASVLPKNIQGWFPLWWTGLISLLSKGCSRVFSNSTVQKHQFFGSMGTMYKIDN